MLDWLKKLPGWLYTFFAVTVLGLLVGHYRRKALTANARMTVDVELAKLQQAKGEQARLDAGVVEQAAQIAVYDEEIAASKREIVAVHEDVATLRADEIEAAFSRLGY